MQYVRNIGQLALLVALVAFAGNSYAASRSEATLHITVTLVPTIATGPTELPESTQVGSSENQDIIYALHPDAEKNVAEAIMSTSQTQTQEEAHTNLNISSKEKATVEVTTVVMK